MGRRVLCLREASGHHFRLTTFDPVDAQSERSFTIGEHVHTHGE